MLTDEKLDERGVLEGALLEPESGNRYPIVDHIPRFVEPGNYADSFGFQWHLHGHTQYDEYSGMPISANRFFAETRWDRNLQRQLILEAGSGSGRFTRCAAETGATVVSFDYSQAVEANYAMNGHLPDLLIVQADIYRMPFPECAFDKAFCFGVLQHTPHPEKAFYEIVKVLRPGGLIVSDIYLRSYRQWLHVKPWARRVLRGYSPEELYRITRRYVDFLWPLARRLRGSRIGQKVISRFVADRSNYLTDANDAMLKEWAYLDTFDWFSPRYDQPQTVETFRSWHRKAGLEQIEVHRGFNGVEGRGRKPAASPRSAGALTESG